MVLVRDRTATTFAVTALANMPAAPSLAERFVELRKITTEYRADLVKALSSERADRPYARIRDGVAASAEAFLESYLGRGNAVAAFIGMCASVAGHVTAATVVGCAEAVGNVAPAGSQRWLTWEPGKGTPGAKPRRGSLEDLLGRVHDVQTYSPTTIAALSAMAEERLRDKRQALTEGARQALAQVVFHGELQDPVEIARSARWVALQKALEDIDAVKDGHATEAARVLMGAYLALEPEEKVELAPLVREAVFDGEKPRKSVAFVDAVSLYGALANASPVSVTVRINDDVTKPDGEATLTRYGREVYAFEETIARAINPECRSFTAVVHAAAKALGRGPYQRGGNVLGYDLSSYTSAFSTRNAVIDPAAIAEAVGRAQAGWHTPLERVGLKLVAQRALVLLDGFCVLGTEARSLLSAIVEHGKPIEESGEERTKLNDQAQKLHAVLDHINVIEAQGGSDELVRVAIDRLDALSAEEKPEIARAVWEQVFGPDLRNAKWFPGSVQLVRKLRAEGVNP